MNRLMILVGLSAALGLTGCQQTSRSVVPTRVEEFQLPPANDQRYDSPATYVEESVPHQPKPRSIANPMAGGGMGGLGGAGGRGGY